MATVAQPPSISAPATSRVRRTIGTVAVVAIWIALGIGLHLSVRAYLLVGIPLTAAFQWGIRREPLRALWLRDPVGARFDARAWIIAAFLVLVPLGSLVRDVHAHSPGMNKLFDLSAVAGAFAAAYALRNFRRTAIRPLVLCVAIAGGIGIAIMVAAGFGAGFAHRGVGQRCAIFVSNLLVMIPLSFVVEEVSFRGTFDAHMHHPGESSGFLSALFVSAMWGLWHLPVVLGQAPVLAVVPQLLAVHCCIGVPLSIYWRRSGNLFVSGSTHALIDAVRNALLILPWH
jgi:Type II CAAX prenyl endopeptidase Rce1-like